MAWSSSSKGIPVSSGETFLKIAHAAFLNGIIKVSTIQVSYGAKSHDLSCPAAGAEAGPVNHYAKTKFRSATCMAWI